MSNDSPILVSFALGFRLNKLGHLTLKINFVKSSEAAYAPAMDISISGIREGICIHMLQGLEIKSSDFGIKFTRSADKQLSDLLTAPGTYCSDTAP